MAEAYSQRPGRKRQAIAKKRAAARQGARQEDLVLGSRTARHHLRATLSAARRQAIPASLAAGVGAAVAGIGGGPPVMGIAFLSGGAASLFKSATEAAATAWLAEGAQRDAQAMSTTWAVQADVQILDECIELMESSTGNDIEACRFIMRRGISQTLEDAADCPLPVREFLWKWSRAQLSLLEQQPFPADKAHQVADLARKSLEILASSACVSYVCDTRALSFRGRELV